MAFNEQYIKKKQELVKNIADIKENKRKSLDEEIQKVLETSKIDEVKSIEEIAKGFQKRNEYLLDPTSGYSKKQEVSNLMKKFLVPELLYTAGLVKSEWGMFDGTKASENLKLVLRWLQKLGYIRSDTMDGSNLIGLIRFQKRMGLTPDGLTGAETLGALVSELWKRNLVASILPEINIESKKNDLVAGAWTKIDTIGKITFVEKEKIYTLPGLEKISFKSQEEAEKVNIRLNDIIKNNMGLMIEEKPLKKLNIPTGKNVKDYSDRLDYVNKSPFFMQVGATSFSLKKNTHDLPWNIPDGWIFDENLIDINIRTKESPSEYPSLNPENLQFLADYLNQEYRKINKIPEPTEQSA